MATIEKRTSRDGDEGYRVKVRVKGFPSQSATFKRRTDARLWAQSTEAGIRERRHFPSAAAKRHTLGELVDRYIAEILRKDSSHAKDVTRHLMWWRQELGHLCLIDLTAAEIARCRDRLSAGIKRNGAVRAPATVARYLASLSHAMTIARREWEWLDHSPVSKVRKPREPQGRVRFLVTDERLRLLAACEQSGNDALYPIVVLALSTGMRLGEIITLRWEDLDFERQLIVLNKTKNGERRGVPLVSVPLEVLRKRFTSRRSDTELVFPRADGKKPLDIRKAWNTAVARAQLKDFRFHDLRHCAASYLAMQSASPSEIAAVLGHKTLQMVKRYAHLSAAHVHSLVSSMNGRIFGVAPAQVDV